MEKKLKKNNLPISEDVVSAPAGRADCAYNHPRADPITSLAGRYSTVSERFTRALVARCQLAPPALPPPRSAPRRARREACSYLSSAGLPLSPPPLPGASPKLSLQNAQTRAWLACSGARGCALRSEGDAAAHDEEQKWTLVALPGPPGAFALRNKWGHYLRADTNDGGFMNMMTVRRVDCSAEPRVDAWEVFRVAPHPTYPAALTLLSAHGFVVGQHNGARRRPPRSRRRLRRRAAGPSSLHCARAHLRAARAAA